ncbi:hypothetical protein [Mucilaginibacter gotjawali]|uniref:Uncharacterized protein n=2 Tax=Mucilaginibacter gotjawali TaxID=1550579 RepID=A0A120MYC5_9SPHI|nr:hypothetical protein [Mucilaginibacter gotjawali]MBB3059089.1 hypothetical protein [Mucilaginibacter gotjawali]BAU52838.1 hypothetical protein MgSA37_01002 [Mucilaginibacter gotjawali]
MKKSAYVLALIIAVFLTIVSCTKSGQLNAPAGQIAATKTVLKVNEPDLLALVGADSTKSVFWTVTPAGHDTLTTQKNGARLVFTKSGDYAVTANQSGAAPASITIKVTDSVYNPDYNPYFTPLTGDEIKLTPGYYKNAAGDTTALAFTATTTNTYCTNSMLSLGYSLYLNKYSLSFVGATRSIVCGAGSSTLSQYFNFSVYQATLANGTFPFAATLNGTTYTGSIEITTTNIIFHWNYTSGVVISPLTLTR